MRWPRWAGLVAGAGLLLFPVGGTAGPAVAADGADTPVTLVSYNVCGGWNGTENPCRSLLAETPQAPDARAAAWAADAVGRAGLPDCVHPVSTAASAAAAATPARARARMLVFTTFSPASAQALRRRPTRPVRVINAPSRSSPSPP